MNKITEMLLESIQRQQCGTVVPTTPYVGWDFKAKWGKSLHRKIFTHQG